MEFSTVAFEEFDYCDESVCAKVSRDREKEMLFVYLGIYGNVSLSCCVLNLSFLTNMYMFHPLLSFNNYKKRTGIIHKHIVMTKSNSTKTCVK